MYQQPQQNTGKSVLSGLRPSGDAAAYGKGQVMAGMAGLNLERAQSDQQSSVQQMQADSSLRRQQNQNQAQRAGNESQERMAKGSMQNRKAVFDMGMDFDYAGLRKRQNMNLKQALLNQAIGDL